MTQFSLPGDILRKPSFSHTAYPSDRRREPYVVHLKWLSPYIANAGSSLHSWICPCPRIASFLSGRVVSSHWMRKHQPHPHPPLDLRFNTESEPDSPLLWMARAWVRGPRFEFGNGCRVSYQQRSPLFGVREEESKLVHVFSDVVENT